MNHLYKLSFPGYLKIEPLYFTLYNNNCHDDLVRMISNAVRQKCSLFTMAEDINSMSLNNKGFKLEYLSGEVPKTPQEDKSKIKEFDISTEEWREYVYLNNIYRIEKPLKLFIKSGSTGHRILDAAGVTHWVPVKDWHVIKWYAPNKPVSF